MHRIRQDRSKFLRIDPAIGLAQDIFDRRLTKTLSPFALASIPICHSTNGGSGEIHHYCKRALSSLDQAGAIRFQGVTASRDLCQLLSIGIGYRDCVLTSRDPEATFGSSFSAQIFSCCYSTLNDWHLLSFSNGLLCEDRNRDIVFHAIALGHRFQNWVYDPRFPVAIRQGASLDDPPLPAQGEIEGPGLVEVDSPDPKDLCESFRLRRV